MAEQTSVPCWKCKAPIHDGEQCYDVGLVHTLTERGFESRVGYEHLEGRCKS